MSSGFWVWAFRRTWLQGLWVYGVRLQNQFLVSGSRIQILFVLAWAVPILFDASQTPSQNSRYPKLQRALVSGHLLRSHVIAALVWNPGPAVDED